MTEEKLKARRALQNALVKQRRIRLREAGYVKVELYLHPQYSGLVKQYAESLNDHALKAGLVPALPESITGGDCQG